VGQESEQLRREIDRTRAELGTDVDALTEKVSPSRVVGRRVDKTKEAVSGLKDKVMGGTSDATSSAGDTLSGAASSVQGGVHNAASTVGDTASSAAVKTKQAAKGNPLAAGVVAFGLGWLVSSLLPSSQKERELAHQVKDQAQPAVEQAGQMLSEVKDNLQGTAQEAVQSVKESATDAADTVKGDAQSAVGDVKSQAQDSGQQLREQAPTPG